MRTISRNNSRWAAFLLAAFFWLSFFPLPAVTGTEKMPLRKFFFGLAAGFFYPQQGNFREIYGKAIWPVEAQLEWALVGRISIFSAARYAGTSGKTVLLAPRQPEETYSLRWRMGTLRLGMNYRFSHQRFAPFVGLGGSCTYYREQWPEAAAMNEGWKGGFFIQAGGRYRLNRFWHAQALLDYSAVPAGSGPRGTVNLGGLSLFMGLQAGIF